MIKIINGKVDTLIEDEDKIELLNNITGKSQKLTSKPPGQSAAINNDTSKRPSATEETGQPTFHIIDMDAELKIISEKRRDFIRTKQILDKAYQQKKILLAKTNKRGSISAGDKRSFLFQDLSDGGATSAATSPLRGDIKLTGYIGDPNVNQKKQLSFVNTKYQIHEAQEQGYTEGEIVSSVIKNMHSGLTFL